MAGGRGANEDVAFAASVADPFGGALPVWSIADGHGGSGAAAYLSRTLPAAVATALAETEDSVPQALIDAVLAVDAGWLAGPGAADDSGACVLVCARDGDDLHTAWAGDCRAVLCRADLEDTPVQLSTDHNARVNAAERERLQLARVPLRRGRVLGVLEPSRAIGNCSLRAARSDAVIPLCETFTVDLSGGDPSTSCEKDSGQSGCDAESSSLSCASSPDRDNGRTPSSGISTESASPAGSPAAMQQSPVSSEDDALCTRRRNRRRRGVVRLSGAVPPAKPSFLLLGTDGLWEGLSANRACDVVRDALSDVSLAKPDWEGAAGRAAAKLCRLARSYSDDDCTCTVVVLA